MSRPVEAIAVEHGYALIQIGGPIPRNINGLLVPPDGTALVIFDEALNYEVRVDTVTDEELDLAFFSAMAAFMRHSKENNA
jgi:hypothetical protein